MVCKQSDTMLKYKLMYYTSVPNVLVSDHRPVIAYYKVNIKKIDENKKQLTEKELYRVKLNFLNVFNILDLSK